MNDWLNKMHRAVALLPAYLLSSPPLVLKEREPEEEVDISYYGNRSFVKIDNYVSKGFRFASIDGSSRVIKTTKGAIIVSAVTTYNTSNGIMSTHPPLFGQPIGTDLPFIAVVSSIEPRKSILDPFIFESNPVKLISGCGKPYSASFNLSIVSKELRENLENVAIEKSINENLLIDGPLIRKFKAETFINEEWNLHECYSQILNSLYERRKGLFTKITRAIGVVKRLENSTMLAKAFGNFYGNDETLLHYLFTKNIKTTPYEKYYLGPIKVLIDNIELKIYYLSIPRHPYYRSPFFLRLEFFGYSDSEIEGKLLPYITSRLSSIGVPEEIAIVDKVSRKITSGLYNLIYRTLESEGVSISYESRLEEGKVKWGQ